MAYVIPSIRMAPRPVYTPRAGARPTTTTPVGTKPDFQALLKKQPTSSPTTPITVTAPTVTPPPAALPPAAPAPATTGTIGSITLGARGPIFNPAPVEPVIAPSAQSIFGANPWISTAGGSGPNGTYGYNKYYFATPETAAKVAQMVGGKVVASNDLTPYGPFVQNQPNQMVQMPDGRLINAGIIASYYDHGWPQQMVDSLVRCEIAGGPTT